MSTIAAFADFRPSAAASRVIDPSAATVDGRVG